MKKVLFVFGFAFFALSSHALAYTTNSTKGAALCGSNEADQVYAQEVTVDTTAKTKKANIAQ